MAQIIKYITKIVGDLGERAPGGARAQVGDLGSRAPRVSFYAFEARFAHKFATNAALTL